MSRWYMSLPKYSKEMTRVYKGNGEFKNVSASHKKFVGSLKQLNINPREYLFEKVFSLFGYKEFSVDIVDNIAGTKKEYDFAIDGLLKTLVVDVKEIFVEKDRADRVSLTSAIKDWYGSLKETTIQHLFANSENQILSLMSTVTNDEVTFVQRLAKAVTALRVEDWNEETIGTFLKDLAVFRETVEEYDSQDAEASSSADEYKLVMTDADGKEIIKSFAKSEYSDRAKLLYNEITNSIEEMGQSISESEIRQIIVEILEKHC